jgi:hypothetical protein
MACIERADLVGARVRLEEALAFSRAVGTDSESFGNAANALGELERLEGNWPTAQSLYEAAFAQARRQGDLRRIGVGLNNLIMTAIAQGNTTGISERLLELLALDEESTVSYGRLFPLILCAGLAALQGDWERSAQFEGAATFHLAQLGWPLDSADKADVESFSARTRNALGDSAFEAARASGRNLSLDEALNELRQWLRRAP